MTLNTTRSTPRRPVRRGNWFWSRLHFLLRLLGLLGLVAVGVGLTLARGIDQFYVSPKVALQTLSDALHGTLPADWSSKVAVFALLGGGAAVLLALLVELVLILGFVAARRSLMGFNAVVQIALAAVLLVGVNVFAFVHPFREDCTRAQEFTLPSGIENDLKKLTGVTTIVVHQRHKSMGLANEKPDRYDFAAERNVVERVKDLVEQFREVGPQFQVVVLDVEAEGYEDRLKNLTNDKPKLREAIDAAPENSIFFYRDGRVQQLSFEQFYRLDRVASKEGRGNLVLLAQGGDGSGRGVEVFADRILNVEQRRPRIGILAVHEALTSEGSLDPFTLKGLRHTLTARGFDVRDIVLRKNWDTQENPDPAADTLDESKLERVESELVLLNDEIKETETTLEALKKVIEDWTLGPNEDEAVKLAYLQKKYEGEVFVGRLTESARKQMLDFFHTRRDQWQEDLDEDRREQEEKEKERKRLDSDLVAEKRRESDVGAKLKGALSDCDLLFIPRITRYGISVREVIEHDLHKLDDQQLAAIKEFLASGRPVFACLGPINEPSANPRDLSTPMVDRDDNLERLFAELGIRLGPQTVLFRVDAKEFANRGLNSFTSTVTEKVPPVDFDSPPQLANGRWLPTELARLQKPSRVRESMRVTARSAQDGFDLRIRFPRPVYYDPIKPWVPPAEAASSFGLLAAPLNTGPLAATVVWQRAARTSVVFLATGYNDGNQPWARPAQVASTVGTLSLGTGNGPLPSLVALPRTATEPTFLLSGVGWNDNNPYLTRARRPRYEPPKPTDPANGTPDEKRRGQFPIGVAVTTPIPLSWTGGEPQLARVAVIGQGDVFTGPELKPAQERLLLQTVAWLLHRDESLPTAEHPWRYPRLEIPAAEQDLWLGICRLGLPAACALLGVVVLLVRRLR